MTTSLEDGFDRAMMDIFRLAKSEANYNATGYFQMLLEHRGLETARILLHADTVSEDYLALWERGRLDLTVEALIHHHPEYHPLFTTQEVEIARQRLRKYEYPPSIDPLESLIGAFPADIQNWSGRHDELLGKSLHDEMMPGEKGRTGS